MMKLSVVFSIILFASVQAREGFGPGEQEWGFVTVREKAEMFWWLYYTTANVANPSDRPLIIWLQGGPGSSSTGFGNFGELGPLDTDLKPRNFTWVKDANVLFVDNPVGTGFSYAGNLAAFTTTNKQIAEDFVVLLNGFYEALPEFVKSPLYVVAESYGGKMTAEIALEIDTQYKLGNIPTNVAGVGLGDSWVSPIDSVLTWAPYLLQIGAVDQAGHDQIAASAQLCKDLLDAGQYVDATNQWSRTESVILRVTNNIDFYNVLEKIRSSRTLKAAEGAARLDEYSVDQNAIENIMNGPGGVKQTLNLPYTWGAQSSPVFNILSEDFMKPATEIVEKLLDTTDIKVFVFNGQLDLIVDTPGTVKWVDNLNWSGKTEWATASRKVLATGGWNEGYQKAVGDLELFWVNRAGHMVPLDNPAAMDYILRKLTNDYDEK